MDWTAEQINEHIDKFTSIEDKPIPDNTIVTVWCDGGDFIRSKGYLDNITKDEMGFEALISRSWILQTELDKLCKSKKK